MRPINNNFMYYYYLDENGEVYNAKSQKYLSSYENRYKLRTTDHKTIGISKNDLTNMVYGYSIIQDNIERLDGEEFVPIPNTDEKYFVSNKARIISYYGSKAKLLSQVKNNENGYYRVRIKYNNGEYRAKLVHQLVAEAFCPVPDGYKREELQVHHKDFSKTTNNSADNLEYLTPQEHMKKHLEHNKERLENNE